MSNEYLADTVIYTVGSLAEWLVDNTQFISLLLPLVVPGLQVIALTSYFLDFITDNLSRLLQTFNLETRISSDIGVNLEKNNTRMSFSI